MPYSRGSGYAPRRGRGGWDQTFTRPKKVFVQPDLDKNPLGPLLKTIVIADLDDDSNIASSTRPIAHVRYIASYNWCSDASNTNTILVPGMPPRWTPLQDPQRLAVDSGQYYRDPNAARYPAYPLVPVVQAVLHIHPDFPTRDIDMVACGSTLGNLLRFVRGQDKPFRFAVQAIGNTVFFLRKESDPRELIPNVRGYGHSFPEAYTTWDRDVKGSETHQRIIQYVFGGFKCLVRFACDGYIKEEASSIKVSVSRKDSMKHPEDEILSAFDTVSINKATIPKQSDTERVSLDQKGAEVSQDGIFDLKTRSSRHKAGIDMSDIIPQLWVKQIPWFIVAYHDGAGLFEDIRIKDVQDDVRKWEADNISAIRSLAVVLRQIIAFARTEGGLLEVYSPRKDCLEIRRQHGEGEHVLPLELREMWANEELSDPDDGGLELDQEGSSDRYWPVDSDDDELDYTACSAEDCGYCGKCKY
ncbi:hypothetical protein ACEQ8H_002346 [Pleosporales sp. CAS-2024a]